MSSGMRQACVIALLLVVFIAISVGAGIYMEKNKDTVSADTAEEEADITKENSEADIADADGGNREDHSESRGMKRIAAETAADAQIDFDALKEENPDIFAWIYIPDTDIDCPVLQSDQSDTFYESHNACGEEDDAGAVYIELANLTSMCDFNTVLHGRTGADGKGLFADLYRFADPDFFEDHEYVYLYLDGNVLIYEIFAAYERENTSLIRTYDFTYLSGCQQFLDDLYGTRNMGMQLRDGWENVSPYNYVITLTTAKEGHADSQFVVLAALTEDAAGTIHRVVTE